MIHDGAGGHRQPLGDLGLGQALQQQPRNTGLAAGQLDALQAALVGQFARFEAAQLHLVQTGAPAWTSASIRC